MIQKNTSNNGGTSSSGIFIAGLTILFIGLKLGGVIDWSWGWVLSPLWITFLVTFLVSFVYALILKGTDK